MQFSNLTIGAFGAFPGLTLTYDRISSPCHTAASPVAGPAITFANGTLWQNAYVERPLVTLAADGTPLSFHVGMGRSSYSDRCVWPLPVRRYM